MAILHHAILFQNKTNCIYSIYSVSFNIYSIKRLKNNSDLGSIHVLKRISIFANFGFLGSVDDFHLGTDCSFEVFQLGDIYFVFLYILTKWET